MVSVIICVFNAGEYLRPSLESILDQTYRDLDVIIIDDGSTDGCLSSVEDLLADERVRVFHQANAGKATALNRALDLVRGDYYAIQDADDISFPTRIEKQVNAMVADPRLGAVFCGNELIIDNQSMAPIFKSKSADECRGEVAAFRMPALDPTGMFRMALAGHLRYEPSLYVAEHLDYILRLGEQHPMMVLGECLYGYRILPGSLTRREPMWREKIILDALRRACDRRGLKFEQTLQAMRRKGRSRNAILDNNIAAHFMDSALGLRQADRRWEALKTGWQCVLLHPADPHYYKALVYALLAPTLSDRLRRARSSSPMGRTESGKTAQYTGSTR